MSVAAVAEYFRRAARRGRGRARRLLPAPPDCPAVVADAMRYSVMAGGKRLRPVLVPGQRRRRRAVDAARSPCRRRARIELIHTYSLIHDDLPAMDDDTLRRGRPTLHVVAGEGMAILAGDGLLTEAFRCSRACRPSDPPSSPASCARFDVVAAAAGRDGMVGGQAIDLACGGPDPAARATALDADGARATCTRGRPARSSAPRPPPARSWAAARDAQVAAIDAGGRRVRPRVPDRRRHPRRRGRVGRARQDRRQGRRRRQAHLSGALRPRRVARAWPPTCLDARRGRARRRRPGRRAAARHRPLDRRAHELSA